MVSRLLTVDVLVTDESKVRGPDCRVSFSSQYLEEKGFWWSFRVPWGRGCSSLVNLYIIQTEIEVLYLYVRVPPGVIDKDVSNKKKIFFWKTVDIKLSLYLNRPSSGFKECLQSSGLNPGTSRWKLNPYTSVGTCELRVNDSVPNPGIDL